MCFGMKPKNEEGNMASINGSSKIRVIVMTDISSIQAGVNEPDDTQSLVRFLLYSNEFDIEGLIATSYHSDISCIKP